MNFRFDINTLWRHRDVNEKRKTAMAETHSGGEQATGVWLIRQRPSHSMM